MLEHAWLSENPIENNQDQRSDEKSPMQRAQLGTAVAVAVLVLGVGAVAPAAADPEPDRPIIAGDQADPRLLILDAAETNWNDPDAIVWEWEPTTALGFSTAEVAAFAGVTDFEMRNTVDGPRVAVVSGSGLAAVISYPQGQRQWARVLPASANLHGVEILPNGNVAITSTNTTSGWVRVYAASQGPYASTYAEHSLNAQSHGALWDPVTERLWFIGKDGSGANDPRIISALAVTGTAAQPRVTEDATKWEELPDIGSHDITADPNDPHTLLIALDSTAWEFDKTASSNEFTQIPAAEGGLTKLKAISRQPSGQTIITRPDEYKSPEGPCAAVNYWCTDTVELFGPDTARTLTGAEFYRARVLSPDYSAIGDTLHGPVADRSLPSGGTWTTPVQFESSTEVGAIAAAALPDGSMHVLTLVPGDGVWDRVRSSGGTWAGATQIDSNPAVTAISAAGLSDGSLHVQTVVPGSGVWDRTRSAAGTWSSASKIDSNGSISAVSASARGSVLHVQTLVPGAGIWDRTRSAGGTWATSATKIADGCQGAGTNDPCITDISSAALTDGTVHVQAVIPGSGVFDLSRSTGGTWSALALIDANDGITRVSAAGLANGTLHVQTVVPGWGIWDRTRSTGGTWSAASKVSDDSTIFETYGVGLAGSELHLGSATYSH